MTKSTITRERLEKIAAGRVDARRCNDDEIAMAITLLAAMDSEPVAVVEPSDYVTAAQLVGEESIRKAVRELYEGALRIGDKLYRHAQPAPVVLDGYVMVPKEPTDEMLAAAKEWTGLTSTAEVVYIKMLAAAPQSPGSEPATVPGKWIPVSERLPPSRHEVLVGRWWGEKPRWCCKWATYIPGHPDAQSSGWLIPGASWTPTHWMELPAAPQEVKSE